LACIDQLYEIEQTLLAITKPCVCYLTYLRAAIDRMLSIPGNASALLGQ